MKIELEPSETFGHPPKGGGKTALEWRFSDEWNFSGVSGLSAGRRSPGRLINETDLCGFAHAGMTGLRRMA
jgi:hypothetical protein